MNLRVWVLFALAMGLLSCLVILFLDHVFLPWYLRVVQKRRPARPEQTEQAPPRLLSRFEQLRFEQLVEKVGTPHALILSALESTLPDDAIPSAAMDDLLTTLDLFTSPTKEEAEIALWEMICTELLHRANNLDVSQVWKIWKKLNGDPDLALQLTELAYQKAEEAQSWNDCGLVIEMANGDRCYSKPQFEEIQERAKHLRVQFIQTAGQWKDSYRELDREIEEEMGDPSDISEETIGLFREKFQDFLSKAEDFKKLSKLFDELNRGYSLGRPGHEWLSTIADQMLAQASSLEEAQKAYEVSSAIYSKERWEKAAELILHFAGQDVKTLSQLYEQYVNRNSSLAQAARDRLRELV